MESEGFYGYYVYFDATGVAEVDAVLEALANACHGSHHTECWRDDYFKDGETQEKRIQDAANASAKAVAEKDARIAALEGEVERLRRIETAVLDDANITKVVKDCTSPGHTNDCCDWCDAKLDGIDKYQDILLAVLFPKEPTCPPTPAR